MHVSKLIVLNFFSSRDDWKNLEFKEYNFEAKGFPVEGGHLHPLLKARIISVLCSFFIQFPFINVLIIILNYTPDIKIVVQSRMINQRVKSVILDAFYVLEKDIAY